MPIRITSKKEGFRRCGIAHGQKPTIYPDDRFSEKELGILEAEPMLIVERISGEPEEPDADKAAGTKEPDAGKAAGTKEPDAGKAAGTKEPDAGKAAAGNKRSVKK